MPVIEEKGEGIAYTFEIHEEAVWDNGTPITGYDYAFTIKSILNPKVNAAHVRGYIEFISDVIVDPENPKNLQYLPMRSILSVKLLLVVFLRYQLIIMIGTTILRMFLSSN
jgi:ABC-type transport system substrate-binding protein